ncbi:MAG: hypothetical protein J0I41_08155 [Filimonas sp.]|nr:hypothetical protein [Filimonas sp.]
MEQINLNNWVKRYCITLLIIFLGEPLLFAQASFGKEESRYVSFWGETKWVYRFGPNYTYENQISGHFGYLTTKGSYKINRDTIILSAYSSKKQPNPKSYIHADTLIIDTDQCLIDKSTGYEYHLQKRGADTFPFHVTRRRNLKLPGRLVIE